MEKHKARSGIISISKFFYSSLSKYLYKSNTLLKTGRNQKSFTNRKNRSKKTKRIVFTRYLTSLNHQQHILFN